MLCKINLVKVVVSEQLLNGTSAHIRLFSAIIVKVLGKFIKQLAFN